MRRVQKEGEGRVWTGGRGSWGGRGRWVKAARQHWVGKRAGSKTSSSRQNVVTEQLRDGWVDGRGAWMQLSARCASLSQQGGSTALWHVYIDQSVQYSSF
jgi:hypothetical protein